MHIWNSCTRTTRPSIRTDDTHQKEGFFVKKFKKAMALSLALAMGLSLVACGDKKEDETTATTTEAATEATGSDVTVSTQPADELPIDVEINDQAIYCYSWNTEFGERLEYVKAKYPQYADLIKYENLGLGGGSDEYKTAIANGITSGGDKVPSVIAMDDALAKYFISSDYVANLADVGFPVDEYKSTAYPYTVDYGTIDGNLKGATWQSTPGCMILRTDIAKEVLGTDDPAKLQEYVKDWDTVLETAETMKAAGYKMFSDPSDVKVAFLDAKKDPWVVDGTVKIDQAIKDYLEIAKKLYDNDYTFKSGQWNEDWNANMAGDVFAWLGCPWFMYWCYGQYQEGTDAEGHNCVVEGPQAFHWGGTYFGVTTSCPNPGLAALIVYTLTADADVLKQIAVDTGDFVNNATVNEEMAASGECNELILKVFNGVSPIPTYVEGAKKIDLSKATTYDSTFNGYLDVAVSAYNTGEAADLDAAVENIKTQISDSYPDLVFE